MHAPITLEPDDLVMFGMYYLPSLVLTVVASLIILIATIFAKSRRLKSGQVVLNLCLVLVPWICWMIYVSVTYELAATLVLLDSESAGIAANTYETQFKKQVTTVDDARRLAVSTRQTPNVRFYSSCLIADLLAAREDVEAAKILKRVEDAPIIETQFIGGNSLTEQFYVPGHAQARLSVGDVVEMRLRVLRGSKIAKDLGTIAPN